MVWDVFVSCRHQDPDGPWVREVLVDRDFTAQERRRLFPGGQAEPTCAG